MLVTGKINKNRRPLDQGFTLIELMVVIFIIGLMAGVVVLSLPSKQSNLNEDTSIIAARFELAAQEALLSSAAIGIEMSLEGYRFLKRTRGNWAPHNPAGLSGWISWPEDSFINIEYDGEIVSLNSNQTDASSFGVPNIFFLPTGESQNVRIIIQNGAAERAINITEDGSIALDNGLPS